MKSMLEIKKYQQLKREAKLRAKIVELEKEVGDYAMTKFWLESAYNRQKGIVKTLRERQKKIEKMLEKYYPFFERKHYADEVKKQLEVLKKWH